MGKIRFTGRVCAVLSLLFTSTSLFLAGCSKSIWNAGDLAQWVREQAVKEGCQQQTIKLHEWYTETKDGNVWHGTCLDASGNSKSFGINVDSVWKPSEPAK